MKKVTFSGKPPTTPTTTSNVDEWVMNHESANIERTKDETTKLEKTKRLTIDVSISLHKRIKSQCALENLIMADEIRDLLEKRFPKKAEQGAPS